MITSKAVQTLKGVPVMSAEPAKYVPASDLSQIALTAAALMENEANYTLASLALTRDNQSVPVFHATAARFSEIGHIYKAVQRHFGFKNVNSFSLRKTSMIKVITALNQLDAQVRFIDAEERMRSGRFDGYHRGIVAHACESGREALIRLLKKAAERLKGGEATLLSPYDVGVMRDTCADGKEIEAHDEEENEDENIAA